MNKYNIEIFFPPVLLINIEIISRNMAPVNAGQPTNTALCEFVKCLQCDKMGP